MKRLLLLTCFVIFLCLTQSNFASSVTEKTEEVDFSNLKTWKIESRIPSTKIYIDNNETTNGGSSIVINNKQLTYTHISNEITVQKNTFYKLSYRIKCSSNLTYINTIGVWIDNFKEDLLIGTHSAWEYKEIYIQTGKTQSSFTLHAGIGEKSSPLKGDVWLADMQFEKIAKIPANKNVLKIENLSNNSNVKFDPMYIVVFFIIIILINVMGNIIPNTVKKKIGELFGVENQKILHEEQYSKSIKSRDILIVGIACIIYSGMIFYNLGSINFPKTSWIASIANESFIVDFGKSEELSKVYFNIGVEKKDKYLTALSSFNEPTTYPFTVEYIDQQGKYLPLIDFVILETLSWRWENTPQVTTSRLKFTMINPGLELKEIAVFNTKSNSPLNLTIIDTEVQKTDIGSIENLFDEQGTIPYSIDKNQRAYFDEKTYASSSEQLLRGFPPVEVTHPPLSKIFTSLGILIFGINPFGWRFMGALTGILIIPLLYYLAKQVFKSRFYASVATLMLMMETIQFVESRSTVPDVFSLLAILLANCFLYSCFIKGFVFTSNKTTTLKLILGGISIGIGIAVKWNCVFALMGIMFLLLCRAIIEYSELKQTTTMRKSEIAKAFINKLMLLIVAFIVIPITIQIASYYPLYKNSGMSNIFQTAFYFSKDALAFHQFPWSHPQNSRPWMWLFNETPISYWMHFDWDSSAFKGIILRGNYAILYTGIIALLICIFSVYKRQLTPFIILVSFAAQYLPWYFVGRGTFLYHIYTAIPFIILMIVLLMKKFIERYPNRISWIYAYLKIVVLVFWMMYPTLTDI